jgi:hypothetical protein
MQKFSVLKFIMFGFPLNSTQKKKKKVTRLVSNLYRNYSQNFMNHFMLKGPKLQFSKGDKVIKHNALIFSIVSLFYYYYYYFFVFPSFFWPFCFRYLLCVPYNCYIASVWVIWTPYTPLITTLTGGLSS